MSDPEEKPTRLFSQLTPRPRAGFPAGMRAIMLVFAVAVAAILSRVMGMPGPVPAPAASAKPVLPKVIRVEVVTPPAASSP